MKFRHITSNRPRPLPSTFTVHYSSYYCTTCSPGSVTKEGNKHNRMLKAHLSLQERLQTCRPSGDAVLQKSGRGHPHRHPLPSISKAREVPCRLGTGLRTPRRSSCYWRNRRRRCNAGETCRQLWSSPYRLQCYQLQETPGVSCFSLESSVRIPSIAVYKIIHNQYIGVLVGSPCRLAHRMTTC